MKPKGSTLKNEEDDRNKSKLSKTLMNNKINGCSSLLYKIS